MKTFEDIMAETAEFLGLDGLEPDEDGICEFISEEAHIVVMACPEDVELLMVTARIAEPSRDESLLDALKANYRFARTQGATISMDPDDGSLVLSTLRPLESLDGVKMARLLEKFMTVLLSLRETL